MNLQGEKVTVNKSDKELFEFLTKTENFEAVLPDDLEEFKVKDDSFIFNMKGMPAVKMVFTEKTPNQTVKLKADNDMVPVYLTCNINSKGDHQSEAKLSFEGEVNMMMAMMVKKPLQNLLDVLTKKMSEL